MWPEIKVAKSENRREIVLNGPEISERMQKNGLDKAIFSLTDLNFLSLTETCLSEIPTEISNLVNLQTLTLYSNKIETIDQSISQLSKLKVLDLSRNLIKNLPQELATFSQIVTINLSNNKLENFPVLNINTKLTVLDLSNNSLTAFPNICNEELANLSEVKLHGNQIEDVPSNINVLPALKVLDISKNKVKSLPGELADCHKLKDLNLKLNPISDRRLLKLIDQCRTKQIMDYVKQNCPRANTENTAPKKGKKGGKSRHKSSSSDDNDDSSFRHTVTIKPATEELRVVVDNTVKTVREHIVCCVIIDVSFTEDTFKRFIQVQNKLHDGVCEKRNSATVATHDLKKLGSGLLKYTTFPPNELKIKPLNRPNEMTGAQLFARLQIEANNLRKEKKRSTYSGIHKYLYLIEGKASYPCLLNDKEEVVSFPPITNSDISKIDIGTTQMFIEVTSTVSQFVCKNVLTELIKETVNLVDADVKVQQVKVVDQEGKLKVVFPSKTDLIFEKNGLIKVVRD